MIGNKPQRKILATQANLTYAVPINMRVYLVSGKNRQYGFSMAAVLLAVLIVATLAVTSLAIYRRSSAATAPAASTYSNTAYGLSYNYPADWTPSGDVTNDPKTSATRQEFGTGLKSNANSNTVRIEILDEPLQAATTWYDQYYAQTPIKVSKTSGTVKGKQSVQYDFVAPTYETKLYLLAVGSKTYLVSSINESLNVSTSATYWSNFDNMFTSLTISK